MGALKDQNRHAEYNQAIKPEKNIQWKSETEIKSVLI